MAATAIFTRDEVEALISHPEIPLDRRIVYTFELLAGARTGEAALRWRHCDPTKQPLGELLVTFSNASRYSARYSAGNIEESHATILVNARRPGESASSESGDARAGSPSGLARGARTGRAGSPVVRALTIAVAAGTDLAAKERTPGGRARRSGSEEAASPAPRVFARALTLSLTLSLSLSLSSTLSSTRAPGLGFSGRRCARTRPRSRRSASRAG